MDLNPYLTRRGSPGKKKRKAGLGKCEEKGEGREKLAGYGRSALAEEGVCEDRSKLKVTAHLASTALVEFPGVT